MNVAVLYGVESTPDSDWQGESCWVWSGNKNTGGYGQVKINGEQVLIHRLTYKVYIGPIPNGCEIHHLCGDRLCYQPAHLQLVTHAETMRRVASMRTHCKRGHPLDGRKARQRYCKTCNRERVRWHRMKRDASHPADYTIDSDDADHLRMIDHFHSG